MAEKELYPARSALAATDTQTLWSRELQFIAATTIADNARFVDYTVSTATTAPLQVTPAAAGTTSDLRAGAVVNPPNGTVAVAAGQIARVVVEGYAPGQGAATSITTVGIPVGVLATAGVLTATATPTAGQPVGFVVKTTSQTGTTARVGIWVYPMKGRLY